MRTLQRLRRALTGIRFRLTLWYVAVLSAIMLLFGIVIVSAEVRSRAAEDDLILRRQAQILINTYDSQAGRFLLSSDGMNGEGAPLRDLNFLLMYDRDGMSVQQFGPLGQEDVLAIGRRFTRRPLSDVYENFQPTSLNSRDNPNNLDYRIYAVAVLDGNQRVGTLVVGRLRQDQLTLRRLALEFLVVVPGVLLMTASGAYLLAARALRPVRQITQLARSLGESDLSRRLNLPGYDEIAELAATFDQMLGRLESAFERQRQFTRDASHELRTPLTIVSLEVQRIQAHPRTPPEYEEALHVIQLENQYMTRLVDDLLTLARADAGQVQLRLETLDLSDLALDVIERLSGLAQRHGIKLAVGPLPELLISGDRLYLTQMLTNLVENAIKYTAGVGQRVRLSVGETCRSDGVWVYVGIEDDGPGIAPEHQAHLFDRFYRVDQARTHSDSGSVTVEKRPGGSGLGLSIVQWIVQAHGGQIEVSSQVGAGSTFRVELPLLKLSRPDQLGDGHFKQR